MESSTTAIDERYDLGPLLAEGCYGRVRRATRRRDGRAVAIKEIALAPDRGDAPVRRIVRESRSVAKLSARGAVPYFDAVWEPDTGSLSLVRDWIEAESLEAVLERDAHPRLEDVLAWSLGLAEVLAALHEANVIHGAVVPGNVFFASGPDGRLVPTLTDIGLARCVGGSCAAQRSSGSTARTFFRSPEHRTPDSISARSDVYGLAALMTAALRGGPLRQRADRSWSDSEPVQGDARTQAVAELIERMMSPVAAERPADGAAVYAALEELAPPTRASSASRTKASDQAPVTNTRMRDDDACRLVLRVRIEPGQGLRTGRMGPGQEPHPPALPESLANGLQGAIKAENGRLLGGVGSRFTAVFRGERETALARALRAAWALRDVVRRERSGGGGAFFLTAALVEAAAGEQIETSLRRADVLGRRAPRDSVVAPGSLMERAGGLADHAPLEDGGRDPLALLLGLRTGRGSAV